MMILKFIWENKRTKTVHDISKEVGRISISIYEDLLEPKDWSY